MPMYPIWDAYIDKEFLTKKTIDAVDHLFIPFEIDSMGNGVIKYIFT